MISDHCISFGGKCKQPRVEQRQGDAVRSSDRNTKNNIHVSEQAKKGEKYAYANYIIFWSARFEDHGANYITWHLPKKKHKDNELKLK